MLVLVLMMLLVMFMRPVVLAGRVLGGVFSTNNYCGRSDYFHGLHHLVAIRALNKHRGSNANHRVIIIIVVVNVHADFRRRERVVKPAHDDENDVQEETSEQMTQPN